MPPRIKFAGPTDRVAIIGRTGSGKTVAGVWHLSGQDFKSRPWLVLNTKGDPLLNRIAEIEGVKVIDVNDTPNGPGLYIVNTVPGDAVAIDALLGRVWAMQNCGTYIDEGYMIEEDNNLNALLTQGRSRNCPVIVLSQRPAWITRYMFSEAEFVQLFNLQLEDDRKKIGSLVPLSELSPQERGVRNDARKYDYRLRAHHSYWYNVGDDILTPLGPVPPPDTLVERIRAKFAAAHSPEQAQVLETVEVSETEPKRRYM